jgi:multidrug efflux pump subunit AcrA (membrane-fusion protein)
VAAEGKLRLLCDAHDALTSPRSRIRPGMIARVRVLGTGGAEAQDRGGEVLRVFIPKRLVARDGGQAYVWVVDQAAGTARRRAVTLGPESGDVVEVTEGLQPSEKLIVGGREGLQPGQRVRVTGEES